MANRATLETIKNRVSVSPIAPGGSNFETHVLTKTSKGYQFKPSRGYALFCSLFALISYGGFLGLGIYQFLKDYSFNFLKEHGFVAIVGLFFFMGSNVLLFQFFKPIVFSKSINVYYKGYSSKKESKHTIPLHTIAALQIIGERVKSSKSFYTSFELNLVLDDASRLNVIDHGNLSAIIEDADILAHYLNIPIWHAESGNKL